MKAFLVLGFVALAVAIPPPADSVHEKKDNAKPVEVPAEKSKRHLGDGYFNSIPQSYSSSWSSGPVNYGYGYKYNYNSGPIGQYSASSYSSPLSYSAGGLSAGGLSEGHYSSGLSSAGLAGGYSSGLASGSLVSGGLSSGALSEGFSSSYGSEGLSGLSASAGLGGAYGSYGSSYGQSGLLSSGGSSDVYSSGISGLSSGGLISSGVSIPQGYSSYNFGVKSGLEKVVASEEVARHTIHNVINKVQVPVPVPQPYPVTKTIQVPRPYPVNVEKPVPVQVRVNVPVPVEKPYPVQVPQPVPYQVRVKVPYTVEKPYPVHITRTVTVPVEKPVYVKVPEVVRIPVPQPYPVPVQRKVAIKVPHPVLVKVPEIVNVHHAIQTVNQPIEFVQDKVFPPIVSETHLGNGQQPLITNIGGGSTSEVINPDYQDSGSGGGLKIFTDGDDGFSHIQPQSPIINGGSESIYPPGNTLTESELSHGSKTIKTDGSSSGTSYGIANAYLPPCPLSHGHNISARKAEEKKVEEKH
ncbi:uncharacterized protein [Diabrotica undecimpunctata]|uniref:uncharacterized protein n=1 Tax=Diabrotica undecimpunctata TaxID=50387 RepID=UPI003B638881